MHAGSVNVKAFDSQAYNFNLKLFTVSFNNNNKEQTQRLHGGLHCIGLQWPMTQMADGHLGLDLNGQWPFRLVSNG